MKRCHERRDGLHHGAHDERFSVCHTALESACAVRAAIWTPVRVHIDFVMNLAAQHMRAGKSRADLDALDRLNGHERPCELPIEPPIPLHM